MIRIEITRRIDCKQGKGRYRVNPVLITTETDEAAAIAHIREMRIAGDEIAPGYMPMLEAKLFEHETFLAWVKHGDSKNQPQPFRTLTAADIVAL